MLPKYNLPNALEFVNAIKNIKAATETNPTVMIAISNKLNEELKHPLHVTADGVVSIDVECIVDLDHQGMDRVKKALESYNWTVLMFNNLGPNTDRKIVYQLQLTPNKSIMSIINQVTTVPHHINSTREISSKTVIEKHVKID